MKIDTEVLFCINHAHGTVKLSPSKEHGRFKVTTLDSFGDFVSSKFFRSRESAMLHMDGEVDKFNAMWPLGSDLETLLCEDLNQRMIIQARRG